MKNIVTPVRGMKDYLPIEVEKRDGASRIILDTYIQCGFNRIETPALEHMNFLQGSQGGENEKLIYKIMKRGEKLKLENDDIESLVSAGLRFDLTIPLARFYANNNPKLPMPFKVIQMGPVWRAERPQKGRYRQFIQCDIDIIGEESILAEIELISATSKALLNLNFKDFKIKINDRRLLMAMAKFCGFKEESFSKVFIIMDKLDKIGIDKVESELSSNGFEKNSIDKLIELMKKFISGETTIENTNELFNGRIDENIISDLQLLIETISKKDQDFSIKFDPTLVRGMGYYTGTIFEIEYGNYSGAIAGGGRYDNMIGQIMGKETSACGFSIGFERILDIMNEEDRDAGKKLEKLALLFEMETDNLKTLISYADELRSKDFTVSIFKKAKKFSKQLDRLKENGFSKFEIFGNNEIREMK